MSEVTDTRGRKVTFSYANGRLTAINDLAGGRTYAYGYDSSSRLASFAVTTYGLATDNLNLNATTTFGYDSSDRLSTITDPRGNETRVTYDGAARKVNKIVRVTDKAAGTGPTTTFAYSSSPSKCSGEDKAVTETKVDGPRSDVDDFTWHCTDRHDRPVATFDAKGHKGASKYTSNSNVTDLNESGVAGGPAFSFGYNSENNLTSVSLPTGGQASMNYGDSTNPHFPTALRDFATDKGSANATWAYDYDDDGNLIEAKSASEDITFRYCYNGDGTLDRIAPPPPGGGANGTPLDTNTSGSACSGAAQGNDTLFSYNTKGELIKVEPPGAHATQSITYDALSRTKTVTDGRGVKMTFSYDALDRVTDIEYSFVSSGGTTSSLSSTTDSTLSSTLSSITESTLIPPDDPPDEGSTSTQTTWINYSYDPNGNLTARADSSGNTTFSYDELNRMTKEAPESPSAVMTYAYDAASNLTSVEASDEPRAVTYGYDATNLVTSVTDQEARRTEFTYNKRGLRRKTTYPNAVVQESRYDDSKRLKCIYSYKGTAPAGTDDEACPSPSTSLVTFFAYDYTDTVGGVQSDTNRREKLTERDASTTSYDYDAIGRLTAATTTKSGSTTRKHAYTYDALSNPTKEVVSGSTVTNSTRTQAYDDAGELCWSASGSHTSGCASPPSGATTYSYDAAGNLASASTGLKASYSLRGHMVEVTPPGGAAIEMAYSDATQDRRIAAGDTRMAYNQLGLSSQGPTGATSKATWFARDPEGTLVAMLNAPASDPDLYYLFDGLGSVAATTDASGNLVRRYAYEPYGDEIGRSATDANPWRYASGYYDHATGMLKFGTRYYMPDLLRWTQRDPLMGKPADPMTLNSYAYVGADPINTTDPSGRSFWDTVGDFLGAASDVADVVSIGQCAMQGSLDCYGALSLSIIMGGIVTTGCVGLTGGAGLASGGCVALGAIAGEATYQATMDYTNDPDG